MNTSMVSRGLDVTLGDANAALARMSGRHRLVAQLPRVVTFAAALSTFSGRAFAQSAGTNPASILTNILTFLTGPFGQTLAVLGIIGIGIAWMFGRASLGLVAGVIGGIVIMFGASYIGNQLTGGTAG